MVFRADRRCTDYYTSAVAENARQVAPGPKVKEISVRGHAHPRGTGIGGELVFRVRRTERGTLIRANLHESRQLQGLAWISEDQRSSPSSFGLIPFSELASFEKHLSHQRHPRFYIPIPCLFSLIRAPALPSMLSEPPHSSTDEAAAHGGSSRIGQLFLKRCFGAVRRPADRLSQDALEGVFKAVLPHRPSFPFREVGYGRNHQRQPSAARSKTRRRSIACLSGM